MQNVLLSSVKCYAKFGFVGQKRSEFRANLFLTGSHKKNGGRVSMEQLTT